MTDISAAIEPAVEPAPVDRLSARAARRRKTLASALAVVGFVGLIRPFRGVPGPLGSAPASS